MSKLSEKEVLDYMDKRGYITRSRCMDSDGTCTFNMGKEFPNDVYLYAEVCTKNNSVILSFLHKMIQVKTIEFGVPHPLFEKVFEKQMLISVLGMLSAFEEEWK